ncbi:MAG: hypothetical protein JJT75_03665 [Opitutales bacterium]|nr:hypothetical protein [Opitutales bacterium]MCH8541069.1 hypothetical protein [Opitutales bacterium]
MSLTDSGEKRVYQKTLTDDSATLILVIYQGNFYLVSSLEEFERFSTGEYARRHLAQSGQFRKIRRRLPENIQSFYYLAPEFRPIFEKLSTLNGLDRNTAQREKSSAFWPILDSKLPADRPVYGGHYNHSDGTTFLSVGPGSHHHTFQNFLRQISK